MRLWTLVAIALMVTCLVTVMAQQRRPASTPCFQVGRPIVHQNLAIFPVRLVGDVPESDYLTLKEAQEKGLVVVRELPEGASVPYVLVENKADKPLLLLGGEVILGGKQDRIVAHDTLVPPKTAMKVKVYCVEPGRWISREEGERFFAPLSIVAPEVRKSAQVEKSQQRVWAENASVQRALLGADPRPIPSPLSRESQRTSPQQIFIEPFGTSQSYRRVLTDAKVRKEASAFVRALQTQLLKEPRACGIIVAVNGELQWLDVFGSPRLFRKAVPALLHSAAVQALSQRKATKQSRVPSVAEAQRFLVEAQRGQRQAEWSHARYMLERVESPSVIGFAVKEKQAPAMAAPALHINAYRK